MRIVFVLTQDLESPSGLGRYYPLARQLVRLGHQVHISATHPNYSELIERRLNKDGVEVNYVAPMHVRKEGSLKQYYGIARLLCVTLQATWKLSVDTIRSDSEIVHIGKPHPMNSVAGVMAKLLSKCVLCVDCDDYEAGSMQFSSRWQRWLVRLFEHQIPKISKLVTVNTHFMREKLLDWGVEKNNVVYLPNGVDMDRFSQVDPDKVEQLRQSMGLEGGNVVAYIGSMSLPSHPVDLLLKAFLVVRLKNPATKLLLVGGGGGYPDLIEMANRMGLSNSVVFAGRVGPNEVPAYYNLADVTVDPVYDNEAARGRSPLKLFESWACGVPFVTSRVGDRTMLIETSGAGLLAENSTPEAYATAISEVLSSKTVAQTLRERGLNAVQQYKWDHLAKQLEQAYQRFQTKGFNKITST